MRIRLLGPHGPSPLLTCCSIAAAVVGIVSSAQGYTHLGILMLSVCGVLDAFDGRFAGLFKRDADARTFGMAIDSLADVVAFGVAPAILMAQSALQHLTSGLTALVIALAAFYVLAAVWRLAWFDTLSINHGNTGSSAFRGVPVTYAALVFPLAFALCKVLGNWLQAGFVMPLLSTVLAALFVLDIEVPRPKTPVLIVLCLASLLASAYVMWW